VRLSRTGFDGDCDLPFAPPPDDLRASAMPFGSLLLPPKTGVRASANSAGVGGLHEVCVGSELTGLVLR
jgi:hypothetical protein